MNLIAIVFTYLMVPETKNKNIEEVQEFFKRVQPAKESNK